MEDDRAYCVYCHTSPSGKKYIGITCQRPTRRWNNGKGYMENRYFYSAIQKYGWENISHEILYKGLNQKDALEKEIELIAKYKSNNPKYGYNLSVGGESGFAGCSWSEEHKEWRRKVMIGNKYGLGYKPTPETLERMREAQLRREHPPLTEEQRRKCIANLPPPRYGRDNPGSKAVLCVETGIVYSCGKEAAKEMNLQASKISNVCNGKRITTGGYHFIFCENKEEVFAT